MGGGGGNEFITFKNYNLATNLKRWSGLQADNSLA